MCGTTFTAAGRQRHHQIGRTLADHIDVRSRQTVTRQIATDRLGARLRQFLIIGIISGGVGVSGYRDRVEGDLLRFGVGNCICSATLVTIGIRPSATKDVLNASSLGVHYGIQIGVSDAAGTRRHEAGVVVMISEVHNANVSIFANIQKAKKRK